MGDFVHVTPTQAIEIMKDSKEAKWKRSLPVSNLAVSSSFVSIRRAQVRECQGHEKVPRLAESRS
jgi:hypothetical protein